MTKEEQLYSRHRGGTLLLDSNLLLLFLAGNLGSDFLQRFPRVREYDFDDYELLRQTLKQFKTILTTPHVLTEITNLANKLSGADRVEWSEYLVRFITSDAVQEKWIAARELARAGEFIEFGITDSAIGAIASEALVLTDDFPLSGNLRSRGFDAWNFKELRSIWDGIY